MSDPHLQEVAHWHPIDGTPEKKRVAIGCSVLSAIAIWRASPSGVRVVAGRVRAAPA